jgi:hypothetical protein
MRKGITIEVTPTGWEQSHSRSSGIAAIGRSPLFDRATWACSSPLARTRERAPFRARGLGGSQDSAPATATSFALVNYFRDINVTQIKYRLLADAVNQPS